MEDTITRRISNQNGNNYNRFHKTNQMNGGDNNGKDRRGKIKTEETQR